MNQLAYSTYSTRINSTETKKASKDVENVRRVAELLLKEKDNNEKSTQPAETHKSLVNIITKTLNLKATVITTKLELLKTKISLEAEETDSSLFKERDEELEGTNFISIESNEENSSISSVSSYKSAKSEFPVSIDNGINNLDKQKQPTPINPIVAEIESPIASIKIQLSFNEMIETEAHRRQLLIEIEGLFISGINVVPRSESTISEIRRSAVMMVVKRNQRILKDQRAADEKNKLNLTCTQDLLQRKDSGNVVNQESQKHENSNVNDSMILEPKESKDNCTGSILVNEKTSIEVVHLKKEEMNEYKKQDECIDSPIVSKISPGEMIGSEGVIKKKACSSVWRQLCKKTRKIRYNLFPMFTHVFNK